MVRKKGSRSMNAHRSSGWKFAQATGRLTEKAAVGLFRWVSTDHTGFSESLTASQNEPGDGVGMDFLAELEQEVAAKNLATLPQDNRAKNRQLHEALLRIFSFLHNMTRHANQLQSEISRSYHLDSLAVFKGFFVAAAQWLLWLTQQ